MVSNLSRVLLLLSVIYTWACTYFLVQISSSELDGRFGNFYQNSFKILRRRLLNYLSAPQFALGLYFYLKEVQHMDDTVERISWLPLIALVVFISTYSIGWGALPWAVMGEMFASNVKAKATGITVSVCWFLAFLITKFSSNMEKAFGNYALFWMFGAFCIISVVFTVLLLPETKGKSLQEIQDELNGVTSNLDTENATK